MAIGPYQLNARELASVRAADRRRETYVIYRDGSARLVVFTLSDDVVTIGRGTENDIVLGWDGEVSRAHARLERVAGRWTVVDDGLSRNGTFAGGSRVRGRRGLTAGDILRAGTTTLVLRGPQDTAAQTLSSVDIGTSAQVSAAERRVLVGLCRPYLHEQGGMVAPASNADIAAELVLSVAGVKSHLRTLFAKLDVDDLPQNRKRAELARRALALGLVTSADADQE